MDAFGGKGTGTFAADTSERTPRFELSLDVPRCRVEDVLEGLRAERLIGGQAALAMHARRRPQQGRADADALREVSLSGRHLKTYDLDVDKLITSSTRRAVSTWSTSRRSSSRGRWAR